MALRTRADRRASGPNGPWIVTWPTTPPPGDGGVEAAVELLDIGWRRDVGVELLRREVDDRQAAPLTGADGEARFEVVVVDDLEVGVTRYHHDLLVFHRQAHEVSMGEAAVRRFVPVTDEYHGTRFFLRRAGRTVATPLFAVLVAVETTDVLFAVDSIPAIFAVTDEPFLVFTSNAFAILGLRALYFLLVGMMDRFVYLKYGLAASWFSSGSRW